MTRIQIEYSKKESKRIETMMKETNTGTKKEFFKQSIILLEWALKEVKEGRTIGSTDKDDKKYREVVMPMFFAIQKEE